MTERYLSTQAHEADLHLIFDKNGLSPYYAMDAIRKDWNGWQDEGKPTRSVEMLNETWTVTYDYDTDNALDPWSNDSYQLQTVPEFRFYFVAQDELYEEGTPADQSQRVRGGTITVRPRWPNLTANGGEPVTGVPNIGGPYIDCQIQASNIAHPEYDRVLRAVTGAFGVSSGHFDTPHDMSNWGDMARYVRVDRDASGPLHAADGPIARTHQLFESDREGFREHTEDNRKVPGYRVTSKITDTRCRELVRGHKLGKEIKHYYPKDPGYYESGDALYHPKLEVAYQTSITEDTLYWDDTQDAVRELEEFLLNALDWAGLPLSGGGPFIDDNYYTATDGERRTRRIVDCPLPEIQDEQEAAVMRLWGGMNQSDQAVTEMLLTDGGHVSPQDAADETGYSYRTVRDVVDRCDEVIRHTYNKIEFASEYQKDLLLDRVRASADELESAVKDAALNAADAITDKALTKWARVRRRYNVTVDEDPHDCRKKLIVSYTADDEKEAENIVQSLRNAYLQTHGERNGAHGVTAVITVTGQGRKSYENLEPGQTVPVRPGTSRAQAHQEAVEEADWDEWLESGRG